MTMDREPKNSSQPYSRKQLYLIAVALFLIVAILSTLIWLSAQLAVTG